ncbi:MAG: septum site-determining protein MinC [Chloroflexota bacterium]
MKTDTSLVAIKGTKHGLTITLLAGPLPAVLAELSERLARTASFFKGAQLTLHVENSQLSPAHLQEISRVLAQHDITLRRFVTQDAELAAAAAALGAQVDAGESGSSDHVADAEGDSPSRPEARPAIARAMPPPPATPADSDAADGSANYPAIVVRRTLRSGAAIQHEGHVIIVGDVNPGAELIAGGDVIVWGKLRGLVHAGALGDNNAIVCALLFDPTQLRIGNTIARMPEGKKRKVIPEMASIRDGKIEVVEWN